MKKRQPWRRVGVSVIAVLCALSAGSSSAAVFEDFEGYTVGDNWKTDPPTGDGWDIVTRTDRPPTAAGIRADPLDASNKVFWYNGGDWASNHGTATWNWGGDSPTWTGNFTASLDIYVERITSGRLDLRMRGENLGTNGAMLRWNADGSIQVFNITDNSVLVASGEGWSAGQWYRVTWDFHLPINDPDNRYFDASVHELSAAGGTPGDQVGVTGRLSLPNNPEVDVSQF